MAQLGMSRSMQGPPPPGYSYPPSHPPAHGYGPGYGPGYPGAYAPGPAVAKPPVWGFGPAAAAFFFGIMVFLISGFKGRSAGWEMLAAPTLLCFAAALAAAIPGIIALTRKGIAIGLGTLGVAGFGAFLALVGFVLGA